MVYRYQKAMQNFAKEENVKVIYFMKDNDFPWVFLQQ